jgi:hypothetical protein
LGNPEAAPTAGVAVLAAEAASGEGDPGFAVYIGGGAGPAGGGLEQGQAAETAGLGESASEAEQSGGLAGPGLGLNPESSLADPKMNLPPIPLGPSYPPLGYFIGTFTLPDSVGEDHNLMTFTADLAAGTISNAYFEIEYSYQQGANPVGRYSMYGQYGSGNVDPASKSISGWSGFSSSDFYEQFGTHTNGSYGELSSSSVSGGFGSGAINFGSPVSGSLQTAIVYDPVPPLNDMYREGPDNIAFSGGFYEKPLVEVAGTFQFNNLQTQSFNNYSFLLNLNNGDAYNLQANIDYIDTASNNIIINVKHAGSLPSQLNGGAFSLNAPAASVFAVFVPFSLSPITYAATGAELRGTFDSSAPNIGSQVTGGQLEIDYSVPPLPAMPVTVQILNGAAALK